VSSPVPDGTRARALRLFIPAGMIYLAESVPSRSDDAGVQSSPAQGGLWVRIETARYADSRAGGSLDEVPAGRTWAGEPVIEIHHADSRSFTILDGPRTSPHRGWPPVPPRPGARANWKRAMIDLRSPETGGANCPSRTPRIAAETTTIASVSTVESTVK
jgi:hypothetical protein